MSQTVKVRERATRSDKKIKIGFYIEPKYLEFIRDLRYACKITETELLSYLLERAFTVEAFILRKAFPYSTQFKGLKKSTAKGKTRHYARIGQEYASAMEEYCYKVDVKQAIVASHIIQLALTDESNEKNSYIGMIEDVQRFFMVPKKDRLVPFKVNGEVVSLKKSRIFR